MKFKNILMALGLGSMLMTFLYVWMKKYIHLFQVKTCLLMVSMNCW